ncbi:hypothetical protein Fmac_026761 [Flemingia macrophylla]|uniref:Uncharacterized protein n=1 Tax=Flemingia macrophylla TaxID=520843 RepID=A0ABD1LFY6_9FABA
MVISSRTTALSLLSFFFFSSSSFLLPAPLPLLSSLSLPLPSPTPRPFLFFFFLYSAPPPPPPPSPYRPPPPPPSSRPPPPPPSLALPRPPSRFASPAAPSFASRFAHLSPTKQQTHPRLTLPFLRLTLLPPPRGTPLPSSAPREPPPPSSAPCELPPSSPASRELPPPSPTPDCPFLFSDGADLMKISSDLPLFACSCGRQGVTDKKMRSSVASFLTFATLSTTSVAHHTSATITARPSAHVATTSSTLRRPSAADELNLHGVRNLRRDQYVSNLRRLPLRARRRHH